VRAFWIILVSVKHNASHHPSIWEVPPPSNVL
jgi:hypothetical protein